MPGDLPSDKPEAQKPLVVLIAEDEEPIADALAIIVEEAGYTPLTASHGAAALQLARTHHPALLITDLMMPYLDGEKLIQALEADARLHGRARIPVILTTAVGGRRLEDVKADALLKKPFDVEDV
ncbi:MAG TPA: response regulator, partial [Ktedonobacterales bacterium]|nr:response regulator [Ktedonobacterales bacterium]